MTGNPAGGVALLEKSGFIHDQNRVLICEMLDHIIADHVTQLICIPAATTGSPAASTRIQPVSRRSLPRKASRNNPTETATRFNLSKRRCPKLKRALNRCPCHPTPCNDTAYGFRAQIGIVVFILFTTLEGIC